MKRIAVFVFVLMLGILPAAADSVSTESIRGSALDAMVREVLEWLNERTEYSVSGAPEVLFLDNFDAAIREYEVNRRGGLTAWDKGDVYKFSGAYDPYTKTVLLREDWGGHTIREWATLVHELVHYL